MLKYLNYFDIMQKENKSNFKNKNLSLSAWNILNKL